MSGEKVEQVASAIHEKMRDPWNNPLAAWESIGPNNQELTRQLARAAIEAMRVPTAAMIIAVLQTSARDVPAERMWQAMIDEALK